jgi:glycosyltransferase involved in cell wall biosynthesis
MKVLLLTFYYHPDLSAGSFRAAALVKALREGEGSLEVEIITSMPNRYSTFSIAASEVEISSGVVIHRIVLPAHKSGMLDQIRAFGVFAQHVRKLVRNNHYDVIVATSSRLMTAVLGAWIASKARVPLYLDIRDIFVDTIKDVLPASTALFARPMLRLLEAWVINKAARVNLVSRGFAEYFLDKYPNQKFTFFTNGIDEEFLNLHAHDSKQARLPGKLRILYAGNIGEGQGLHSILPALGRRLTGRAQFKIIGDGGRKVLLKSTLELANVHNVELLPPMSRERLIKEYEWADVLFLHLNNYDAFRKVLPSKIFEYAAMGKPILAGVQGYSAKFVSTEICNAAVFPPCDAVAAEDALATLSIVDTHRVKFVRKYRRENICRNMATDILALSCAP